MCAYQSKFTRFGGAPLTYFDDGGWGGGGGCPNDIFGSEILAKSDFGGP